jgi:hypothetical protein
MPIVEFLPLLFMLAIPMASILLLFPFAALLPRWVVILIATGSWATALVYWTQCTLRSLSSAGFQFFASGGYTGAVLTWDSWIKLRFDPAQLVLSGAVLICGGMAILSGLSAWGGGKRTENRPASPIQIAMQFLVLYLLVFVIVVDDLGFVLGATSLVSMMGFWLLLTSHGELRALMDTVRLGVVHRIGDLGLFAAGGLIWFLFPDQPLSLMAEEALRVVPYAKLETGPLTGLQYQWVYFYISLFLCVGVASRMMLFPLQNLVDDIDAAPLPLLGLAHGFAFLLPSLLLFFRLGIFFHLGPEPLFYFGFWLLISVLWTSFRAIFSSDAIRIDLSIFHLWVFLVAILHCLGDAYSAMVGTLLFCALVPALLHPLGAAIESMQGQRDLWALGGLWKQLRRSDFTRAVATLTISGMPGLTAFFFFYGSIFSSLHSPRFGLHFSVGIWLAFFAISLLSIRSQHLIFSGDAPRQTAPANLVEVEFKRWLFPLLLAFSGAAFGLLVAIPEEIINGLFPPAPDAAPFQTPLRLFLSPAFIGYWTSVDHILPGAPAAHNIPFHSLILTVLVLVAVTFLFCSLWSLVLYRNGPSAFYQTHIQPKTTSISKRSWHLGLPQFCQRAVITPVLQFCTIYARGFYVLLFDLPITRLPVLILRLVQTAFRFGHSGNVQRSIAFLFIALCALLSYWWST